MPSGSTIDVLRTFACSFLRRMHFDSAKMATLALVPNRLVPLGVHRIPGRGSPRVASVGGRNGAVRRGIPTIGAWTVVGFGIADNWRVIATRVSRWSFA